MFLSSFLNLFSLIPPNRIKAILHPRPIFQKNLLTVIKLSDNLLAGRIQSDKAWQPRMHKVSLTERQAQRRRLSRLATEWTASVAESFPPDDSG